VLVGHDVVRAIVSNGYRKTVNNLSSNDADEAVAKEHLHANLRPRLAEHANVQVKQALALRTNVLVGLGREAQANAGASIARRATRRCAEASMKPSLARTVNMTCPLLPCH